MIALSASKITTYLQCPRKYRFRYVERLQPAWKVSALAFGSAIHGTLETFHQQRIAGATMSPDAVAGLFQIDLAAELAEEIRFKEDETVEELRTTGQTLVKLYAAANQNVPVTSVEQPFELEVIDGILLRGVFDAVLEGDRVRELKTAARDYDEGTLSRNIQFSAYAWAYRQLFGRDAVVEVVALLKTKHPRIETHGVTRTHEDQDWFIALVAEVAWSIRAGAFPPNPSWSCSDCEYADPCRRMRGGT